MVSYGMQFFTYNPDIKS